LLVPNNQNEVPAWWTALAG